jgi:hypothetical protein
MPPELIVLAPGDVIQVTDNRFQQFGDLLIVETVEDFGVNAYKMDGGDKHGIQLRWGEFEFVGRARVIFKG